jgi:uncharacterized repeat protein (TIGR02543 family)
MKQTAGERKRPWAARTAVLPAALLTAGAVCVLCISCGNPWVSAIIAPLKEEGKTSPAVLYTVTFNSQGGSPVAAVLVNAGSPVTQPSPNPDLSGSYFGGWYTDPACTVLWNFSSPVTANVTLYAKWTDNPQVIFNANGGTPVPAIQSVTMGGYAADPAVLGITVAKTGYTLAGWYDNAEYTGTAWDFTGNPVTASVTLYARWVIAMVNVPGGSFTMGSPDGTPGSETHERPMREVTLSAFWMGKYEVTQSQWETVMGTTIQNQAGAGALYGVGANYPVYYVRWYEVLAFCNKLSIREGLTPAYSVQVSGVEVDWANVASGDIPAASNADWDNVTCNWNASGYRLPTEAEWEYAARGGNGSPGGYTYAGSNDIDEVAWYNGNGGGTSHEAGQKQPNGLGLYDMSGNVWEWCWDFYGGYPSTAETNPAGSSTPHVNHINRGGAWQFPAQGSRSAYRGGYNP